MGFRWAHLTAKDVTPFDCNVCTDIDTSNRNCFNHMKLSEDVRAVVEYTDDVKQEILDKGCGKVFSLGDVRLYECPLSYITKDTYTIMQIVFLAEESHILYIEGGWANQPSWFVEAYNINKVEQVKNKEGK